MKLCISNIAWESVHDNDMYRRLHSMGIDGIEIAPTRIFARNPYGTLEDASKWAKRLYENYGLCVPSIQSIWYGHSEKLFGSENERRELLSCTKKAVEFAKAVGSGNIVFGCPSNRDGYKNKQDNYKIALAFFRDIGMFADGYGVNIGIEANPEIYHTDFLNKTSEAILFVKDVGQERIKVNLDTASLIYYNESCNLLKDAVALISHVQISEPGMLPVSERILHIELKECLEKADYDGYISLEMGKNVSLSQVLKSMKYVKDVFG